MISVKAYTLFPTVPADERLYYGRHELQFIDLFLPAETVPAPPLVFLIHGGCWQAEFGLNQMGQFARALAKKGTAVCNIEYRRLGNGGGWPTTFLDVAAAFDFLPQLTADFPLDLKRIIVVGHSAGGHLALWLASRPRMTRQMIGYTSNPIPIKGVISLAGIPDLKEAVHRGLCDGAVPELLNGMPDENPEPYHEGSPDQFLPFGMPHVHIIGKDDWIVPLEYVQDFVNRAQSSGDPAELISLPGVGHFEIVQSTHAAWETVARTVHRLSMAGESNNQ